MDFWNGVVAWFNTGLTEWGEIGKWILYFLNHPWYVLAVWLGWTVLSWAWGEAKGWSATGPKWWKPFLTTVFILFLLLFAVGMIVRYVAPYGHWLMENVAAGAADVGPVSPPDGNAPKETPVPTQSGDGATPMPTQSQSATTSGNYKVTDSSGGGAYWYTPVNNSCVGVTHSNAGVIPYGQTVTISDANIYAGAGWVTYLGSKDMGLTSDGKCIFMGAVTAVSSP